jgi:hypothetical protein
MGRPFLRRRLRLRVEAAPGGPSPRVRPTRTTSEDANGQAEFPFFASICVGMRHAAGTSRPQSRAAGKNAPRPTTSSPGSPRSREGQIPPASHWGEAPPGSASFRGERSPASRTPLLRAPGGVSIPAGMPHRTPFQGNLRHSLRPRIARLEHAFPAICSAARARKKVSCASIFPANRRSRRADSNRGPLHYEGRLGSSLVLGFRTTQPDSCVADDRRCPRVPRACDPGATSRTVGFLWIPLWRSLTSDDGRGDPVAVAETRMAGVPASLVAVGSCDWCPVCVATWTERAPASGTWRRWRTAQGSFE